jgi:hypothetical protein
MDQHHRQPYWQPTRGQLQWAGGIVALAFLVIVICGYFLDWKWTGFVTNSGFHKRTLWNWLDLLFVPIVLAIGGYLFTRSENNRTLYTADRRAQEERRIADQRTLEERRIADERIETDRKLAKERIQDEVLQSYINEMGQMLLDRVKPLRQASSDDESALVAWVRTLAALDRLDASRKKTILLFLYRAGLIGRPDVIVPDDPAAWKELRDEAKPADQRVESAFQRLLAGARETYTPAIMSLAGADLNDIDLKHEDLLGINLSQTVMKGADLTAVTLYENATLRSADLEGARLSVAQLRQTTLSYADLTNADLSAADLEWAVLENATLIGADLRMAFLEGATLDGADLSNANLEDAFDVTAEQLAACKPLEGAILPSGRKHEG